MPDEKSKSFGFTLIELLVAITILMLIAGGAIAAFTTFQERRMAEENAKKLQQIFLAARNKAQVKETPPSTCTSATPLQGYRVQYNSSSRTISLRPLCGANPVPITDRPTSTTALTALDEYTLVLPSGTTTSFANGTVIDFYTLQRGTNGSGEAIYSLSSSGVTYGFKVQRGILGGAISNVQKDPS